MFLRPMFPKEDSDSEEAASLFDNGGTRSPEVKIVVVMPCIVFAKVAA